MFREFVFSLKDWQPSAQGKPAKPAPPWVNGPRADFQPVGLGAEWRCAKVARSLSGCIRFVGVISQGGAGIAGLPWAEGSHPVGVKNNDLRHL